MIEIQKLKQFPLVFRLLEEYSETRWTTRLAIFTDKLTNEELVLFLDEQKIFLNATKRIGCEKWYYAISDHNTTLHKMSESDFKTRTEATESGILKAFELLEHKLKQN